MANTPRRPRSCEVCGEQYRPTYHQQRTCGRVCGAAINGLIRGRRDAPKTSTVSWRCCKYCSVSYTAQGRKRCGCTAPSGGGVKSLECKDCAKPFGYLVISNYPARCPDCREVVRKQRQRDSRKARRALQRGAQTEPVNVAKVYERDRWKCGLCHKRVDRRLRYPHPLSPSLDHVVPLSFDGGHNMANVQLAHLRCNVAKSNGGSQQLALIG